MMPLPRSLCRRRAAAAVEVGVVHDAVRPVDRELRHIARDGLAIERDGARGRARARASDAKDFEGHARGPAGLGSVCAQAVVVVLLVLNGVGTPSADAATVWVVFKHEFPQPLKTWAIIFRCLGVPTGITACPMGT